MKLVTIRNGFERAVCESGDVGWGDEYYQRHLKGSASAAVSAAESAYDFIREPEVAEVVTTAKSPFAFIRS